MKLGIFLLIFGLLIAAVGVAAFMYADPNTSFWIGGRLDVEQARLVDAVGMGITVLGGGLAIGGIVRMIVKK